MTQDVRDAARQAHELTPEDCGGVPLPTITLARRGDPLQVTLYDSIGLIEVMLAIVRALDFLLIESPKAESVVEDRLRGQRKIIGALRASAASSSVEQARQSARAIKALTGSVVEPSTLSPGEVEVESTRSAIVRYGRPVSRRRVKCRMLAWRATPQACESACGRIANATLIADAMSSVVARNEAFARRDRATGKCGTL